jgi:hypothetical protein
MGPTCCTRLLNRAYQKLKCWCYDESTNNMMNYLTLWIRDPEVRLEYDKIRNKTLN